VYIYDGLSLQNGRNVNMDSLLLTEREIAGQGTLLAVVCDGVGSMEDGAFAAALAVKSMSEWFSGLTDINRIGFRMRDEAFRINAAIVKKAREAELKTAATFTAVLFAENRYYTVHIGDTRAYSYDRDGAVIQLTVDDVSESGKLTGCVGLFDNPVFLCTEGEIGDKVFLICSDGLYKKLDVASTLVDAELRRRKDIKKVIRGLAEQAIERGERDNISIALVIPNAEGSI
jgi:serine/threonine protein phosphatase PrpC